MLGYLLPTSLAEKGTSPEYVTTVREHFKTAIEKKKCVSLSDCREFLKKFPADITAKQLQDRIRCMIKSSK